MSYTEEFLNYLHLFEWECNGDGHCPDWKLFKSVAQTKTLCEKAESLGGPLSVSHFIIAFRKLKESGEIKQLRQPPAPEPPEFKLTVDEYSRLSAREVVRRYKDQSEPGFKIAVDALVSAGAI
jgi:hypothetical protein